ncbi:MAG TPA: chemotaxis-specific protein-glutamate methyltransferase CheB [Lachnospiraceae bacterium]|nr:chemotaxis-specific protein-glutamate methyltransferase CheB [Lachnospiraceae bacterium]
MKKNILVVDDSALMRRLLSDIINSDSRFWVSKFAFNGLEALDLVTRNNGDFDAIILDINMPKMSGLEFLENVNKLKIDVTVIVVSTVAKQGAKETIRALELGAFDFVTKPESFIEAKGEFFKTKIIDCLSVATQMKRRTTLTKDFTSDVLRNIQAQKEKIDTITSFVKNSSSITREPISLRKSNQPVRKGAAKLVALACSTGGPKALQKVIPFIAQNLDASFLIVQHMPEGFTNSLAQRLNEISNVKVKEAEDGELLQKGCVYIAKGGYQMRLKPSGSNYVISVSQEAARNGLKPCADILYESLQDTQFDEITCVILTGMGGDGTQGIKKLNNTKNIYVIAQDEETSTVYGMPKVIAEAGLVNEIVPIEKVAEAINNHVGVL